MLVWRYSGGRVIPWSSFFNSVKVLLIFAQLTYRFQIIQDIDFVNFMFSIMVRIGVDRSGRVEDPYSRQKLPWSSHPIYNLRRWLIIIAIIGAGLSCVAYSSYNDSPAGFDIFFLGASIFFASWDLTAWAVKRVDNPEEGPDWPSRSTMAGDVMLCVILQFFSWVTVGSATDMYSTSPSVLAMAYAGLVMFICSLIHAYSFWKQLIARYKKNWLASLTKEPCCRCGYLEVPDALESTARPIPTVPPNTFSYTGPSASHRSSDVLTPEATESNMEEGLLINPDFESSYGSTASSPELTIDQTEQVVIPKGKKKKAANKQSDASQMKKGKDLPSPL